MGCTIISAAGNEGSSDWGEVIYSYPAGFDNVLSVASIYYKIKSGSISFAETYYSNRNSMVDACSIGQEVLSTTPGNLYGINSGTSMACPHVSGYAALLHEKINKMWRGKKRNNSCNLFSMVKASTVPINTNKLNGQTGLINNITGAGMVTAFPKLPTRKKFRYGCFYIEDMDPVLY
ncbi:hypothetical protein MHBO_000388 [Bonamia ostreae]|uniref:subtilisin n=1 Tax=Bonamia ostreae TaxID=126728 RepID=A0ABV2AFF7_9EUKA